MTQKNKQSNIVSAWFDWHYSAMPGFLLELYKNYAGFVNNFFSIPLLLSTLISPWRHEVWRAKQGFNIGDFFASIIYNTYSRLMGFALRILLILFGIVSQIILLFLAMGVIAIWLMMPLLIPILIFFALYI